MTRSWFDEWSELKFLLSGWVSINPRNHIQIKWFTNRVVYFSAGSSRMPRIAYGSNKKRSFFASKWDNKWSECSKDSLKPQLMGLPRITISIYAMYWNDGNSLKKKKDQTLESIRKLLRPNGTYLWREYNMKLNKKQQSIMFLTCNWNNM